jgi:quinol monooxygenase YgiN
MSTHVVTEFKTKPSMADELIAVLASAASDSINHQGCLAIRLRREQDDPSHIVSFTEWESRQNYIDYLSWRTASGLTDEVSDLLTEPMSISYFDEIASLNHPAGGDHIGGEPGS